MTNDPKTGPGIDPEILAAFVDNRLTADERAVVEGQLAVEPDSYAVLVEVLKAHDHFLVPQVPQDRSGRWVLAAGAALAAAAALVLMVRFQPDLRQWLRGSEAGDPRVATLVAAVGEERYIEARLAGGFKYGPLKSVTRGPGDLSQQNLTLLAAAGELKRKAEADPSSDNLHAWGVAQLLLREADGAVDALRRAADARSSAAFHSDLSAALLQRAATANAPEDLPAALDAADAAIRIDRTTPEAWFNRALASERLGLTDTAIASWDTLLTLPDTGGWAAEAQQHLQLLKKPKSREDPLRPLWPADAVGIQSGDAIDMERVRFAAERQWLGATCAATGPYDWVTRQVEAYRQRTGDRLLSDAVSGSREAPVCAAYEVFADALARLDRDDLAGAEPRLEEAHRAFVALRHPFALWAEYHLASTDMLARRYESAERRVRSLRDAASSRGYRSLEAHAQWTLGVVLASTGRFRPALDELTAGLAAATDAQERVLAGRLENQTAEIFEFLGETREAWQHRRAALQLAGDIPNRRLRHSVYGAAASVLARRRLDGAAADFLSAQSVANRVGAPAVSLLTIAIQQARLALTAKDIDGSARFLDEAERLLGELANDPRYGSLSARVAIVRAQYALLIDDPMQADAVASSAVPLLDRGRDLQLVDLLLTRAQARAALSRTEEAVGDARQALTLLRNRRADGTSLFGSPDLGAVQDGIDSLLEGMHVAPALALDLIDASRTLVAPLRSATTAPGRVDDDTITVCYKVLPESTLIWTIVGDQVDAFEAGLTRPDAVRAVRDTRSVTLGTASEAAAALLLEHYYDVLLAPIEPRLRGHATIRIVPDWPLDGFPFAALRNRATRRYLVEDFVVVLASTAAVRQPVRARIVPRTLDVLVIADPEIDPIRAGGLERLSGAAREADALSAFYQRTLVLTGPHATPEALVQTASRSRVVHVAAHAVVDRTDGRRSKLLLADGAHGAAVLFGEDLAGLNWHGVDVVVLAACSTAEPDGRPASPMTLASQVMAAGPAYVVATLAPVDDRLAETMFVELHRQLALGSPAPIALQHAQQSVLRSQSSPALSAAQRLSMWSSVAVFGS